MRVFTTGQELVFNGSIYSEYPTLLGYPCRSTDLGSLWIAPAFICWRVSMCYITDSSAIIMGFEVFGFRLRISFAFFKEHIVQMLRSRYVISYGMRCFDLLKKKNS